MKLRHVQVSSLSLKFRKGKCPKAPHNGCNESVMSLVLLQMVFVLGPCSIEVLKQGSLCSGHRASRSSGVPFVTCSVVSSS